MSHYEAVFRSAGIVAESEHFCKNIRSSNVAEFDGESRSAIASALLDAGWDSVIFCEDTAYLINDTHARSKLILFLLEDDAINSIDISYRGHAVKEAALSASTTHDSRRRLAGNCKPG